MINHDGADRQNLASLYTLEEQLREKSLATINGDSTLSEHWTFVAEAMGAIYAWIALAMVPPCPSPCPPWGCNS